jgi:aminomethyltransferase
MTLLLRDIDLKSEKAVVKPAGLGARDTLRMEAGMPLYGHELGEEINALSCGVDFAIAMDKHTKERGERFIGQDALEQTVQGGGPARKLAGIQVDGKRTPRQGMSVQAGGREIGTVTSGCLSPTLGYGIAMAIIDSAQAEPGNVVSIDTGRGLLEGKTVKLPFYKAPKAG